MKFIRTTSLVLFFIACSSKKEQTNSGASDQPDAREINKTLIKRVYADLVNKRNYPLIDSFYASNIIDHNAFENQQQGREGFKKAVTEFFDMFSVLDVTMQDIIAEEDLVATRETWKVTVASDKKALNGETIHFFKIKDGLITDEWSKGWEWLGAPVVLQSDTVQVH